MLELGLLALGLGWLYSQSRPSSSSTQPSSPPSAPPPPADPLPATRSTSRWSARFAVGNTAQTGSISRTPTGWSVQLSTYRVLTDSLREAVLQLAARAYELGATSGDVRVQTTDGAIVGVVQRNSMPDGRYAWNVQTTDDVVMSGVQVARNLSIGELADALQLVVDDADEVA